MKNTTSVCEDLYINLRAIYCGDMKMETGAENGCNPWCNKHNLLHGRLNDHGGEAFALYFRPHHRALTAKCPALFSIHSKKKEKFLGLFRVFPPPFFFVRLIQV